MHYWFVAISFFFEHIASGIENSLLWQEKGRSAGQREQEEEQEGKGLKEKQKRRNGKKGKVVASSNHREHRCQQVHKGKLQVLVPAHIFCLRVE